MSISHSLSNALSGMTAASRMAEVVSSNLSNALTDGYGRRSLDLSAATIGGRGAGVEIGGVTRHVDRGILSDRRLADANLAQFGSLVETLGRIEDVIGQADDPGSISARIVSVEAALVDAATDPASTIRLSNLGDRLTALTESLNTASTQIQSMRASADASIEDQVSRLNTSLSQIEQLNADITYARNTGVDPSSLQDQRQRVVDEVASIVPVRELERDGGQIALMTPAGETLLDGRAQRFEFTPNATITPDMTLQSGGLNGLTLDGDPIAPDGIGKMTGGTLGAAFQARDVELVEAQRRLDGIAADLIGRFEDPAIDPTQTAGQAGLLTDGGAPLDLANTTGLAARISVNAAVDPAQGGTVTNLRDGTYATTPGAAGDATFLQALSLALSTPAAGLNDPVALSAAGRAAAAETATGAQRLTYESEQSFANARWSSLKEAEAAEGVDSDYEMQMLLRVEQAYAANARVIQAVEMMMKRLMEI